MSGEDKSSKTEKATPKKKKESRKEGQIAKSQDLYGWIAVMIATFIVPVLIGRLGGGLMGSVADVRRVMLRPDEATMNQVAVDATISAVVALIVFLLVAMVISAGVTIAQVGFILSGKPIKPQIKRVNPIQGFKRLVSVRTAWQALTGVLKMTAVGVVSIPLLYGVARDLIGSSQFELREAISYVGTNTMAIIRITALVGIVIALADYAFQRWKTNKDMMMTKHDVKQEHKNSEGDPQVRAKRQSMRMASSRNRMIASVADADVVLTNPTHVAVALRYQPERGAPRVVARGGDGVAARIRHEARTNGVPIVESRPLARALFGSCRVDDEIPKELFEGVALVLAFVHRLKGRPSLSGEHAIEVPISWDPQMSDLDASRRRPRSPRHRRSQPDPHLDATTAEH